MIEYKPAAHRLILSHRDVMRVKQNNMFFIRPCKATSVEIAHQIYQSKGSPWGRAIEDAVTDMIYSSEKLIKTSDGLVMYEDGRVTDEPWPVKWVNQVEQRAMYQPRALARFEADVIRIDAKFMDELHQTDFNRAGFTVNQFRQEWDHQYPDHQINKNPLVWIVEMDNVTWRR